MRFRTQVAVLSISIATGFLSSCGGDPLDYETAMNLLRQNTKWYANVVQLDSAG